jgi:two-component system chemotaxis response regulator CheB
VLIVDDSIIMRELLREMLSDDPGIEVVGAAEDPIVARDMIRDLNPDVITLDIDMPRMDGLEFLRRLMRLRPLAAVVISSHVQPGGAMTIAALEMGAIDCVAKPGGSDTHSLLSLGSDIIEKVKVAAAADFSAARARAAERVALNKASRTGLASRRKIVGIGASTGGVQALCRMLQPLPETMPPILISQHMPGGFTRSFAERLDDLCALSVREAEDGDLLEAGHAYVSPGGYHVAVIGEGPDLRCRVVKGAASDVHAPSVDILFKSLAVEGGTRAIGILLTGMGRDGARGLDLIRKAGGTTICQDESSSMIFGMPGAAVELGAAQQVLPLHEIPAALITACARPLVVPRSMPAETM